MEAASPFRAKKRANTFTNGINKTENIREHLVITEKNNVEIEKESVCGTVCFVLYAVTFFLVVYAQLSIVTTQMLQEDSNERFFNTLRIQDTIVSVDGNTPTVHEVQTIDDLTAFILGVLDPSRPLNDPLLFDGYYINTFEYYFQFTSTRLVQQRIVNVSSDNNISTDRWDPSFTLSTATFGHASQYTYSEIDNGFPLFFNLSSGESLANASDQFTSAIEGGFIDSFTSQLLLDLGFYSPITEDVCYSGIQFQLPATGIITSPKVVFLCTRLNLYSLSVDHARAAFEIIFVILTLYYLVHQVNKVLSAIRAEKRKEMLRQKDNNKDEGKLDKVYGKFSSTLNSMIQGFVSYVTKLWSFIDAASILLSIIAICCWCKMIFKPTLKKAISSLQIQNQTFVINSSADLITLQSFNQLLVELIATLTLYYRCCAINSVLILLKAIKVSAGVHENFEKKVILMIRLASKTMSFIVLFVTVLLAFTCFLYYFFGHTVSAFSDFGRTFFYIALSTIKSWDQVQNMLSVSYLTSFFFFLVFCITVNFILVNMFLIYVVVEYRAFSEETRVKVKKEKEEAQKHVRINPLSLSMLLFYEKVVLRFLKLIRSKSYQNLKNDEEKLRKEIRREGMAQDVSIYDQNIEQTLEKEGIQGKIVSNDATAEKLRKKSGKKFVTTFWNTILAMLILTIYIIITVESHKIDEANLIYQNVQNEVKQIWVDASHPSDSSPDLDRILSISQLKYWLVTSFSSQLNMVFVVLTAAAGSPNIPVQGPVLGNYNLLPSNDIYIRIRRRIPFYKSRFPLDAYQSISLTSAFSWDSEPNPKVEFQGTLANLSGGTPYMYNYTADSYQVQIDARNFSDQMQAVIDSGLIDGSMNSISIEIPLYHIVQRLPVYFALVFYTNTIGNIDYYLSVQALPTLPIGEPAGASDIIIIMLQFLVGIFGLFYFYSLIREILKKRDVYNHWYEIYIQSLPETYKRKRFLIKPEFLRKTQFVLDAGEIISVVFCAFILTSLVLNIVYLYCNIELRIRYNNVLLAVRADTPNTLSYSIDELRYQLDRGNYVTYVVRITDAITTLVVSMKIIYCYSFFSSFKMISKTVKNAFKSTIFMAISLLVVLFAFANFLRISLGPIDIDFVDIGTGWRDLLQNMFGFADINTYMLINYPDPFLIVFFFFPFLIFTRYLLYNVFVGMVYNAYDEAKLEKQEKTDKTTITIKEFFQFTLESLKKKKDKRTYSVIEFSAEFQESVNPNKVMDRFRENYLRTGNVKDVNVWSVLSSNDLIYEYETRKKLRKKVKEVTALSLEEHGLLSETPSSHSSAEKIDEFRLREQYWTYFRLNTKKINMFYKDICGKVNDLEYNQIHQDPNKSKQEAVDKLMTYIQELETKIEANFADIDNIQQTFKRHGLDFGEDDEQMHSLHEIQGTDNRQAIKVSNQAFQKIPGGFDDQ